MAIDAFLGLEPDAVPTRPWSDYVEQLKRRLDFAYKVATGEAAKQAKRHKRR